jgi:cell division protein FtsQ
MARKSATILQEELYAPSGELREELDDPRLLDLDAEQESPFLRAQKRIPARRGSLPRKTATWLLWSSIALFIVLFCGVAASALYHYGQQSWRFRINSSDDIEIDGLHNVTREQVMDVMGGDIGRNIFFVPLTQRKAQLEKIPWVASASVMRFVPNRLRVVIHERTPIAFARVGSRILLVDSSGTLMDIPPRRKYSFPVIVGMNPGEPPSTRQARMDLYNQVIGQLDSGGAHYSQDISEIDLSDPDDIKVLAGEAGSEVLVHLGSSNYLERYKIYVTHVQEWRQQFSKLDSVDLRYDRQIVVNPDLGDVPKSPPVSARALKTAMAAGVRPAALVSDHFTASQLRTENHTYVAPKHLTPQRSFSKKKPHAPVRHAHAKSIASHWHATRSRGQRPKTVQASSKKSVSRGGHQKPSPEIKE